MTAPVLETERLILRPIAASDADGLHRAFSDARAMRFWDFGPLAALEDTRACIRAALDGDPEQRAVWALATHAGALAGMINCHNRDTWNRRVELGWILLPEFWRGGYMAEALQAVIGECFAAQNIHRIEATIDPRNLPAVRLADRLGFRREGLMHDRVFVDGEFRSVAMYGLLRSEWNG